MKLGKLTTILAATALAAAPTAASAAPFAAADVRAGAPMAEESDLRGNRSASMVIGFVLLVAILAVVLSNGEGPDSP